MLNSGAAFSIAILLHSGGAQAGQAEAVDRVLPAKELLHRQSVAAAGLIQAEQAAAHSGDHFRLAAGHPTARRGRRQIGKRQRTPIGTDDIAHACLALINHNATPKPTTRGKSNLRAFKERPRAVVNELLKHSLERARKALISGLFARFLWFLIKPESARATAASDWRWRRREPRRYTRSAP